MFERRRSSELLASTSPHHLRRSFVEDLNTAMEEVVMPDAKDSSSTIDEEDGSVNVTREFNALIKKLCDENLTDTPAVQGPITAWRLKHLPGVDNSRLLAFFNDALPLVIARLARLEQNQHVAQKKTVAYTVALTLFDTLSDYSALAVLVIDGSNYAIPMAAVLLVSMMCQALTVRYVTKEGPIAMACALLGLKPILDGINIVFEIPPQAGAVQSTAAFGWTRVVETASESIPFVMMQALALLEKHSIAQWVSFGITVANISHAVASVDYSFDVSTRFRNVEPLCYGYYLPGARGDGLCASVTTFALGYVTAKIVAMAMLGSVSGSLLALVLISESIGLWLTRFAVGNWRWFSSSGDSTAFSLISYALTFYPLMLAAPFPLIRHPFFLTPLVYSGFIAWSLFAANPLMLLLAFRFDDEPSRISQWVVWSVLGTATCLSVLATLAAFVLMKPSFRSTFYRHRTMATHVRKHYWVRSTKWDGTPVLSNDDMDSVRAQALGGYASAYWPTDLARQWTREGWARWLSNPPVWFTEQWRARIPVPWFEGGNGNDGSSIVVPMTTQEANFRLAVDQTPPWNLSPRELEAYFDDHFVNSSSLSLAESEKRKRRHLVHLVTGAGGGGGFFERCCTSDTKAPWVRISNDAHGKPIRADAECLKQLTSFLCLKGLAFYHRLYAASVSLSPLHECAFVKPLEQHEHIEHLLCRDLQTKRPTILTFASADQFPTGQSALAGIQRVCETSEFVASVYQWGSSGPVMFIFGEHCGGGPLAARIKPDVGVEDSEEFWRLALQLAQGVSDIHRAGLVHSTIQVC